jgi:hypothetical protein
VSQTGDDGHLDRVVLCRERMERESPHQLFSQSQVYEVLEPETVGVEARPLPVGEHTTDALVEDPEGLAEAKEEPAGYCDTGSEADYSLNCLSHQLLQLSVEHGSDLSYLRIAELPEK